MFKIFKKKKKVAVFDAKVAINVLRDLTKLLDELGIPSWLTDGTLLGFYREANFIGHDKDMDIGVFISDFKDELFDKLEENGWKIVRALGSKDQGLELTLRKDLHNIDIFFFYEDDDCYWHAAWQGQKIDGKRYRKMIKYSYHKFQLIKAQFLDSDFNVPLDTEKYIVTKYGKDWRTPVKDWDWAFGPSNAEATDIIVPEIKKRKR
ncbi:MAG: LicD family protein [Candidatus Zophobacter franzmannii]|nr:LicD family protein [Candidatus Zophobacter franzmannii]